MFKDFDVWKFPIIHVNTSMFNNKRLGHWRLLHRCHLSLWVGAFRRIHEYYSPQNISTIHFLPRAARYNWCQGPVPGRGPAVGKHWSKAWVCSRSPAEIVGSNPAKGLKVCLLWVLCVVCQVEVSVRRAEFYCLLYIVVCDLETSWIGRPWPNGADAPKEDFVRALETSGSHSGSNFRDIITVCAGCWLQNYCVCKQLGFWLAFYIIIIISSSSSSSIDRVAQSV
jgi:hypothetical protein